MDRRQYLRHFLLLFSGSAAAQAANLLSYPLLARLYSPAQFGVFAIFAAAAAIPGAVACGRFDLVVPTAPHAARHAVLWLCLTLSGAMGLLTAIGGTIYWLASGTADALALGLLLGLAVFLTGYTTASTSFLLRHDRYRAASMATVVRTATTVLLQIGLAFAWSGPMALIAGFCAGLAAQATLLTAQLARHVGFRRPRMRRMATMFRRYRRQVAIDIPSTFLAALNNNVMAFFLTFLFGQRAAGLYAIGNRIAIVPLQLFNDALAQVFFQKAARAQEQRGDFWPEMRFNLLTSTAIFVPMLIGMWLFAEPFVRLYLGPQWHKSATILMILAPMLAIRSIVLSIATTVFVLRRVHWLFWHNVASVAVMAAAFGAAWAGALSLHAFLGLAAALMALEFVGFGAILIAAARNRRAASLVRPA